MIRYCIQPWAVSECRHGRSGQTSGYRTHVSFCSGLGPDVAGSCWEKCRQAQSAIEGGRLESQGQSTVSSP